VALDGGDHGLRTFPHRDHESAEAIVVGAHRVRRPARGRQALQVAAGAEVRTVAAQHHAAQRGVAGGLAQRRGAGFGQARRQRVACRVLRVAGSLMVSTNAGPRRSINNSEGMVCSPLAQHDAQRGTFSHPQPVSSRFHEGARGPSC
jgi:hypothetical protein